MLETRIPPSSTDTEEDQVDQENLTRLLQDLQDMKPSLQETGELAVRAVAATWPIASFTWAEPRPKPMRVVIEPSM